MMRNSSLKIVLRVAFLTVMISCGGWEQISFSQDAVGIEPATSTPASSASAKDESWQVMYLAGQRIGFSHATIETVDQAGISVIRTSSISNMTIKRFNQSLQMKQTLTTDETSEGDLLRFRFEMANPPAMSSVTSGIIEGKKLLLTQEVNREKKDDRSALESRGQIAGFPRPSLKEESAQTG